MNRSLLFFLLSYCLYFTADAQSPPKREFRGAWIATYANIDWPNRSQTPAQQRAALIAILDHHKATGINAVFLQVRSQCDALYPSAIEPWSADLTGTQGKAPSPLWDPLQFAIEESRKRGMELHAWLNPYRAAANASSIAGFAATHVTKQHPGWLLAAGVQRILDPGIPEVRNYVNSVIADIVQRYDVDGIHFDDYFYPNATFNDDATYNADPRGISDRGDWRRDNVNLLIQQVSSTIAGLKPWVKFGVSPSGIYRNSTNPAIGTNTSGLQHYVTLFADSRKWLQEGWIDYLAPQVYWYIGQPGADYGRVVPWWNDNTYGRHMYIGMAGYKVNDPAQGTAWANPSQIPNQVRMNRSLPNILGQAVYNTSSLRSATRLGFRDSLRLYFYNKPALQPTMPWKDATPPVAPATLTAVKYGNDSVVLEWTHTAGGGELDKARQFVIYRSESPEVDITDAGNIYLIANSDSTRFNDRNVEAGKTYYYTVTAADRLHNESAASNTVANLPPAITCPGDQRITLDAACSVALPDFRLLAQVSAYSEVTLTQHPAPRTMLTRPSDYIVTLTATDRGGNSDACSFIVTTLDITPPVISTVTVNTPVLFPPNHKMRDIRLTYTATDNCTPVTTKLSVSSNEPVYAPGDGNTGPDWEVVDDHRVKLRAERSGTGEGRVYTITVTATDAYSNSSTKTVTVSVPHQNAPVTTTTRVAETGEKAAAGLSISALPNPTTERFTLVMQSVSDLPLTIRVLDNTGRVLETRKGVAANGTITFGSRYRPGLYYVEVAQGDDLQILKLVKQPR
jgi:uncharacterized lipoprotein YddW (UPF0748 family)